MAIKVNLVEIEELESFVISAVLGLICHCYPSFMLGVGEPQVSFRQTECG